MECGEWLELTKVDCLNIPLVIQRNTCKIHILNINLGFFDTRLKRNKNKNEMKTIFASTVSLGLWGQNHEVTPKHAIIASLGVTL